MDLPYMIASHATGTFAYFSGGAIRRVGLSEAIKLKEGEAVWEVALKSDTTGNQEAAMAAATSKLLFGV